MPRKTDRNFLADFATLDIEYLPEKGPEVSSDIQMVYVMGNVAPAAAGGATFVPGWEAPDPILADYSVNSGFIAPVVAEFSRVEVLAAAGGGGIWMYAIYSRQTGLREVRLFTLAALSGLGTTVNPTAANSTAYGSGAAATAIFEFGAAAGAAPANSIQVDISTSSIGRGEILTGDGTGPIYIAPGRVFVIQDNVANTGQFYGCSWREIP